MLLKINKLIFLFALIFSEIILSESIINVEELRRDSEKGLFTTIAGSLDISRGNRNRDSFSFQTSVDFNKDNLETFFVAKRSIKKINNNNYDSSTLLHLRLNFLFDNKYSFETYTQYSKNPFRKFNKRELFGIGSRFNINKSNKAGLGLLNEDEKDLTLLKDNTIRIGAYIHSEFKLDENIYFDLTAYYQPSISSFDDYKATLIGQFDFFINENFKISLQYNTFYDSKPPITAVRKEEGMSTLFSYTFN